MPRRIYLDAHATTPTDPEVVAAMLPYFNGLHGNPASPHHVWGREAAAAVELARERVARLIGAAPAEIVFTAGATEANNLAILGSAPRGREEDCHLVTAATEHVSVLDPCRAVARRGARLTILPVDRAGHLSLEALDAALETPATLVTLMAGNNEIGTLHPLPAIAARCRKRRVPLHTDAAQAVGHLPVDVETWGVDMLSLSAHKFQGPKGVGALYIRGGSDGTRLVPVLQGGGQEDGLRPGTANVPAIVGLGEACRLAGERLAATENRVAALRDQLQRRLQATIRGLRVNGDQRARLPHNLNITIPGVEGRRLAAAVEQLAMSTGSACSSALPRPSHVLLAIGMTREEADESVRLGLLRDVRSEEIEEAAERIAAAAAHLRRGGAQS